MASRVAAALPGKVLVLGATGVVGKHITSALLAARPRIPALTGVSVLSGDVRKSGKVLIEEWRTQGAEVHSAALSSVEEMRDVLAGVDTVVSCLAPRRPAPKDVTTGNDFNSQIVDQMDIMRLAGEPGSSVRWFFPREYFVDVVDGASPAMERAQAYRREVRAFARDEKLFRDKELTFTHIVTSADADGFVAFHPKVKSAGGFDSKKRRAVLVGDGTDRVGLSTYWNLGKIVAAALAKPSVAAAAPQTILKLQEIVTTPREILDEFMKQTQDKDALPWQVTYTPKEKLQADEDEKYAKGAWAGFIAHRRFCAEGKTVHDKTDNEALGLEGESLETLKDVVERAIKGENSWGRRG